MSVLGSQVFGRAWMESCDTVQYGFEDVGVQCAFHTVNDVFTLQYPAEKCSAVKCNGMQLNAV